MSLIQRFLLGNRVEDDLQVGLFLKNDGTVWVRLPDRSEVPLLGAGIYGLTRHAILFTETFGDGTYVGTVDVPPGTSILDMAVFVLAGPWNADSASLVVGDADHPDGYITAANADLVGVLNTPYDPTTALADAGISWTSPGIPTDAATPDYGNAAALYAGGGHGGTGYIATVRYPTGGTITATVTTAGGSYTGPIAASRVTSGSPGAGYAPGDTGIFDSGPATYRIDTVDGDGAVITFAITDPGTGYIVSNGNATDVSTGGGDGTFEIDITAVSGHLNSPGQLVVDVIGFGVPPGASVPVKS